MIFFSIFILLFSAVAQAQEFQGLVGEYPFATTLEVDGLISGNIRENNISASHTFERVKNSKVGVFGRYFELANKLDQIPNYYNIQFGLSYRHYLNNGKSVGLLGSFGSSSNKPFRDGRDSTIALNSTYQLDEKWIILGNYSNNRTFLNNIPLPGFIYVKEQSREKSVMLGFPFIYILKPFYQERFSLKYIGILPYNHKLRILYNDWSLMKPYVAYEQGPQVFFDSGRELNAARTFWFERKFAGGAEKSFGPFLKIDLQLGNSFGREYFEARSFMRQHKNVQKIHDATYVALTLKSSF